MAEHLSRNLKLWVSRLSENPIGSAVGYNTPFILPTDFQGVYTTNRSLILPQATYINDLNKVGGGNEQPTTQRIDYWTHPVLTISEEANADMMAKMLFHALGGGDTITPVSGVAGAFEHLFVMQSDAQGLQLPAFTVVGRNGFIADAPNQRGIDFTMPGFVPDSFSLGQTRAETPTWSAECVGSGKFLYPSGGANSIAFTNAQKPTIPNYVHGAGVNVEFTDPQGNLVDVGVQGRVRAWNFTYNNALIRDDRRPQDPFRVPNDPSTGAFVNHLMHGVRGCTASVTVSLHENLREWIIMRDGGMIQNIRFTLIGNIIGGTTNYRVEILIPRAFISGVSAGDENDQSVLTIDFFPVKVAGQEYVTVKVINTVPSYTV